MSRVVMAEGGAKGKELSYSHSLMRDPIENGTAGNSSDIEGQFLRKICHPFDPLNQVGQLRHGAGAVFEIAPGVGPSALYSHFPRNASLSGGHHQPVWAQPVFRLEDQHGYRPRGESVPTHVLKHR